ncbi:hypothetical protein [Eoetvoesiella caeni]|uniref:Uncharacterized protein n=1 Tax=Eoetvoesiella caeni TaxID=645616 RepID=A0A366H2K2_9BURK|nr:hypothetical protein [Eoetvoesiella caeni]MCI2811192.1 hypothetical protein [Eoetvoesiella caeni]NYT57046.1 hypothetical protein [Eoetvoesiella caeni]RBP35005.1 hypothetical protein DFR37_1226 [Eoetvoesiella caeni]
MNDRKSHGATAVVPEGYETWLDYAVTTLDVRTPELLNAFEDKPFVERDAMRSAAREELQALRAKAAQLTALLGPGGDHT